MSITTFSTPPLPGGEKSNTGLIIGVIILTAGLYWWLVIKPEQDAKKAAEKK